MPKQMQWDAAFALYAKAILNGATRVNAARAEWHIAGNCEEPYITEYVGRPSAKRLLADGQDSQFEDDSAYTPKHYVWMPGRRHIIRVFIATRCNKCERCARSRRRLWMSRIKYETDNAPRTWFGTLTLNPMWLLRCEVQGRKDGVSPLAVSGQEVTRYLKRLRKHATGKLRFVCVTEEESSGEREFHPHYHMLVHEQTRGAIKHAVLAEQWSWGFERWRVVDPQTQPAWYLCKYLTKSSTDRIRASILYGGRQKEPNQPPKGIME